jgi:phosphohistidine phosphatase
MKLYLLRHAEAEDGADDPRRRLTRKGRRDARALGKALGRHKLRVRAIWHSGYDRAVETAEEVAPHLRGPARVVKRPGLTPGDSVATAAKRLAKERNDLMIVGHEPFLGKLAAQLVLSRASVALVRLRKPSVVCLERDDEDGGWRISWMLPVKV